MPEKLATFAELYTHGGYLERNPTWHLEESPWKARQILRMLAQNHLLPQTVCEVGCGAGEILKQLHDHLDDRTRFWGYEISPQAFALCRDRANERLQFKLADIRQEEDTYFDLILVMDVLEHLEDYFGFLRGIKAKSQYKLFHIPLDLSAQAILRGNALIHNRDAYGHIHYFTKETALRTLADTGYEVLDAFYTADSLELPSKEFKRNLLRLPRKLAFALHKDLAARILGGFRLLVLAK